MKKSVRSSPKQRSRSRPTLDLVSRDALGRLALTGRGRLLAPAWEGVAGWAPGVSRESASATRQKRRRGSLVGRLLDTFDKDVDGVAALQHKWNSRLPLGARAASGQFWRNSSGGFRVLTLGSH